MALHVWMLIAASVCARCHCLQVNVEPQSRKDRRAKSCREDLEKMRLRSRKEGYCHYEVSTGQPAAEAVAAHCATHTHGSRRAALPSRNAAMLRHSWRTRA